MNKHVRHLFIITVAILLVAGSMNSSSADQSSISELYSASYTLESKGKFTEAIEKMMEIKKKGDDSYTCTLRLAWLLYNAGRYSEAADSYQRAAGKAPKAIEPLLGQMLPLQALFRWTAAEKVGLKVLAMDKDNASALSQLAWIYYNLGKFDEAARYYQRYLQLYPSNISIRTGLGWTYVKLKKYDEAKKAFKAVLRVSPLYSSALQGMASINK